MTAYSNTHKKMAPSYMEAYKAWRGAIIHSLSPTQLSFFPDGILVVSSDTQTFGEIVACDHWQNLKAEFQPAGAYASCDITQLNPRQFIMPGMIDMHVHLPQVSVAGRSAEDLLDWLKQHIFAEETRFENPAYAKEISHWFFQQLLANGTTTAAVFLTSHPEATHIAFEAADAIGNRVVMGQNLMDCNAPDSLIRPTKQILQETDALRERWHNRDNGRLQYAWMPRFAITCSPELMAGIGQLRRQHPTVYMHTHLSEQLGEIAAVHEMFPDASDYTDVYEQAGLLAPKTILAHSIHLTDDELTRITKQQSALAHCPGSNFFLKSGRFRWFDILAKGILFGLGSDVGAGPELSIFNAMRDAQYQQSEQWIQTSALFYSATLGGAKALMQDDRLGNFLPGKDADFLIVDLNTKAATARTVSTEREDWGQEAEDWLAPCIYLGDDRLIKQVYIRGRQVHPV